MVAKLRTKLPKGKWRKAGEGMGVSEITKDLPLLQERQSTHGDFSENARVMQGVKRVLRTGDNWLNFLQGLPSPNTLVDVQAEAIEMIVVKLGRIVTGDPNHADNWADIEGYARLARERL